MMSDLCETLRHLSRLRNERTQHENEVAEAAATLNPNFPQDLGIARADISSLHTHLLVGLSAVFCKPRARGCFICRS
jgi:hypothetical protein